jgi:transposase InsO family protein
VLQRHGLSRLRTLDRATGVPVRYVRARPGELVHLDVKQLARIPDGGGHRLLGRQIRQERERGAGYDYLHVAVDDASRLAYVAVLPDQRGSTAARFLLDAAGFFADHGIRIERVLTDRAFAYTQAHAFREAVASLGARHRTTRPYRPQTNGKAERFIRTLLEEWAYARLYRTNAERLAALPGWLAFYNHRRPHTALGGRPPIAAVNNVHGNYN